MRHSARYMYDLTTTLSPLHFPSGLPVPRNNQAKWIRPCSPWYNLSKPCVLNVDPPFVIFG